MEGVNVGGIMLGYLSLLVLAVGALAALALLPFRLFTAARVVFACGLLAGCLIAAVAVATCLQQEYRPDGQEALILVAALTLAVAGGGPFVAALRSSCGYGAALACAVASLLLLASPLLNGDFTGMVPGLSALLKAVGDLPPAVAALLVAIAGLALGAAMPVRPRSEGGRG